MSCSTYKDSPEVIALKAQRDALAAALRQVDQAAPEIEVNLLPGVVDDWRQLADVVRAALAGVRS